MEARRRHAGAVRLAVASALLLRAQRLPVRAAHFEPRPSAVATQSHASRGGRLYDSVRSPFGGPQLELRSLRECRRIDAGDVIRLSGMVAEPPEWQLRPRVISIRADTPEVRPLPRARRHRAFRTQLVPSHAACGLLGGGTDVDGEADQGRASTACTTQRSDTRRAASAQAADRRAAEWAVWHAARGREAQCRRTASGSRCGRSGRGGSGRD